MKTSIETINGELMTVVKIPVTATNIIEELNMNNGVNVEFSDGMRRYIYEYHKANVLYGREVYPYSFSGASYIIKTLPALPENPKPEDAALLYRYMAEGIYVDGYCLDDSDVDGVASMTKEPFTTYETHPRDICEELGDICEPKITHATDKDGNKISVAISSDAACKGE